MLPWPSSSTARQGRDSPTAGDSSPHACFLLARSSFSPLAFCAWKNSDFLVARKNILEPLFFSTSPACFFFKRGVFFVIAGSVHFTLFFGLTAQKKQTSCPPRSPLLPHHCPPRPQPLQPDYPPTPTHAHAHERGGGAATGRGEGFQHGIFFPSLRCGLGGGESNQRETNRNRAGRR